MPISMKKYVDIKSGINNIRTATEKELIARIFTTSDFVPKQEVIECESLDEVKDIFGISSEEYNIAEKYFGFINKYARSPKKISFGRDYSEGFNGYVIARRNSAPLSEYKELNVEAFGVKYGDLNHTKSPISGSDFNSCSSLSDVATLVQGWIRTMFEDDDVLQTLTVTYNDGKFVVDTGNTDNVLLTFSETVADMMGLSALSGAVSSVGAEETNYTDVFKNSYEISNNFATFIFLGLDDKDELSTLATFVKQNYPSEFMMVIPVDVEHFRDIQSAVANIDGVSLEHCYTEDTKYNFVLPMAITATTDYNKENGTVDYMYTQDSNMGIAIDNDEYAKDLDELKINYYGRTQQAGQKLAFYQNGVLQGNYQDQNIYVNEIWLKDALVTKFLNYMLLTANWYANKAGQSIGQGLIVDIIERAKLNGTITTEKEISENDKNYIYNITTDENAWRQIYQLGYYLITSIEKVKINNQDTYQFNYTLLYSKGDSIKKVEGQNILI